MARKKAPRKAVKASTSTALVERPGPFKGEIVASSTVKVDVALTVDNLAELPAGELEDLLDETRDKLQSEQASLKSQYDTVGKSMTDEVEQVTAAYKHKAAYNVVTALANFFGVLYDVLIESSKCDMQTNQVELTVYVLPAADKVKYLGEKVKNPSYNVGYSERSSYSDDPEISTTVQVAFNTALVDLKAKREVLAKQLQDVAGKLVKVESAYSRLPKMRERAKRQLTKSYLQGELQTNDDVLKMLEELLPSEAARLPLLTNQN